MSDPTKLSRLFRERARNAEKEKLKELYKELYQIQIVDSMFLNENESTRLKKAGYEKVFKQEGTVVTDFNQVKSMFEVYCSNLTDKNVVLFHLDQLNCGVKVPFRIIHQLVVGANGKLLSDVLILSDQMNHCFCIEVEEHNYVVTHW